MSAPLVTFFGELIITEELVFLIVANLFFAQRRKLEQLQQLAVVHLSIAMAEAACELQSSLPRSFFPE